jgi:hypothetical protein
MCVKRVCYVEKRYSLTGSWGYGTLVLISGDSHWESILT